MAGRWLPMLAVPVAALTLGLVGGPLGPASARAAESASGGCADDGFTVGATVKYRRLANDLFIGGVTLKIDETAGPRNRVRLVVRRDGATAFNYTSGRDVTSGPYTLDYGDHPIRVQGAGEIRVEVTVEFDADEHPRCTAVVRI